MFFGKHKQSNLRWAHILLLKICYQFLSLHLFFVPRRISRSRRIFSFYLSIEFLSSCLRISLSFAHFFLLFFFYLFDLFFFLSFSKRHLMTTITFIHNQQTHRQLKSCVGCVMHACLDGMKWRQNRKFKHCVVCARRNVKGFCDGEEGTSWMAKYSRISGSFANHSKYCYIFVTSQRTHLQRFRAPIQFSDSSLWTVGLSSMRMTIRSPIPTF